MPGSESRATVLAAPIVRVGQWVSGWPRWWSGLSPARRFLPSLLVALWLLANFVLGALNGDHLIFGAGILVFAYSGPLAARLLDFSLPVLLATMAYDAQRYTGGLTLTAVHIVEPYRFDQRWFGISTPSGILTPNEWLQLNTHPALDILSGIFYLLYVPFFVAIAGWMRFRLGRTGTGRRSGAETADLSRRLMWAFLWLNLMGYVTYHVYPAAPPWYVSEHGFADPPPGLRPNPAGALRFDAITGLDLFAEFYSRSTDVFGAIPSLHIAYPLLALWFACRAGALRVVSLIFAVMMCFAAVYLNHHYILDLLVGAVFALAAAWLTERGWERRPQRTIPA